MTEQQALDLARAYRAVGGQRRAITLPSGNLGLDLWQTDTGDAQEFWNKAIVPLDTSGRNAFLKALLEVPA